VIAQKTAIDTYFSTHAFSAAEAAQGAAGAVGGGSMHADASPVTPLGIVDDSIQLATLNALHIA
jgi:hypothetical protein